MKTSAPLDLAFLRSEIVGIDTRLTTPYGSRLLTYADYTASGRSLHFVEEYLLGKQELYANSHTEDDTTGRVTTELLHLAEERIKTAVNAGPGGRIIATGSGATGAIDRMQQIVGVRLPAATRLILQQLTEAYLGDAQAKYLDEYCRAISRWYLSAPMNTTLMKYPGVKAWPLWLKSGWIQTEALILSIWKNY